MKTTPTPETLSMFGSVKQNLFYAIIAAVVGLGVIWLHDALVLGVYMPSEWAFISGGGMFLVVLVATAVSSSMPIALALVAGLLLMVYFFPAENHEVDEVKDAVVQLHIVPAVTSILPEEVPATVEPDVTSDDTSVVEPPSSDTMTVPE
jgi:hypothetical protein